MASRFETKPPAWFWIVSVVLLLWELQGVYACVQEFRLGADAMGPASEADRARYATLPAWYLWVFALAVGTGLLGTLALLARKAAAKPLFVVSLIAVIVQFGWYLAMTDALAVNGFAAAAGLPIAIVAVGVFSIWLADTGIKRGWLR